MNRRIRLRRLIGAGVLAVLLGAQSSAFATAVPVKQLYTGYLRSGGVPVTTAQVFRFSYWKSSQVSSGDISGAGALNVSASAFGGWQETQTVTPDSTGYFAAELGDTNPIDYEHMSADVLASLYLQIEVKPSGAPDTAFEVLDADPGTPVEDRSPIATVPFAANAHLLDQHAIGTQQGNVPLVGTGGKLPVSLIAPAVNEDTFTIDADNTSATAISLRFGDQLGKTLSYDTVSQTFKFNDDVRIEGNLTVTGLVNGVNLASLTSGDGASQLRASSGAGLSVLVEKGNYRINGSLNTFNGDTVSLPDNATEYLFFTGTGLTVGNAYPTKRSYIPVAKVVTSGGSVTTIQDQRATQSDSREHSVAQVLHAAYPDAVLQPDGSNNIGQLSTGNDPVSGQNYYQWVSTKVTLQDYDVLVRFTIPPNFTTWNSPALRLTYRTDSGDPADSTIDMIAQDEAGNVLPLTAPSTSLSNVNWTTAQWDFAGTPDWSNMHAVLLRVRLYSRNQHPSQIGDLSLRYTEMQ